MVIFIRKYLKVYGDTTDEANSNNTVGIDFPVDNNSISFRFIVKITAQTDNNGTNKRC